MRIELFRVEARGLNRRKIDVAPRRRDGPERDAGPRQVDQQVAFAAALLLPFGGALRRLVLQLSPRVWRQVLEAAGVPGVRGDRLRRVVVAERDVVPLLGREQFARQRGAAVFHGAAFFTEAAIDAVRDQNIDRRSAGLRPQRGTIGPRQRLLRHGQHRAVERRQHDAARFFDRDLDAERFVEPQDRAGLGRARRVVLARNRYHGRLR